MTDDKPKTMTVRYSFPLGTTDAQKREWWRAIAEAILAIAPKEGDRHANH